MPQTPAYSFNYADFVVMFPAFASAPAAPALQLLWNQAGAYISNTFFEDSALSCNLELALNLMTAHLAQIFNQISSGQGSGITISATIDKISVSNQAIPTPNQWQSWLNGTEYGKQLLALLQVQAVGGFYIPGNCGPWNGRGGFRT